MARVADVGGMLRAFCLGLLLLALPLACVEDPVPTPSHGAGTGRPGGSGGIAAATERPTPRPSTPRPSPTPEPTSLRYKVRPGDTLFTISRRFKTPMRRILAANPRLVDPNRIEVDQVLLIPPKGVNPQRNEVEALGDNEDDGRDQNGDPVDNTPGYLDISRVEVELDEGDLVIDLTLLGVPPMVGATTEAVTYRVVIDTADDEEPEWVVSWTNTLASGRQYTASLQDRYGGRSRSGKDFPGSASSVGSTVRWRIPLKALDNPELLRLGVSAESVFQPGKDTETSVIDTLPTRIWPDHDPSWMEVATS